MNPSKNRLAFFSILITLIFASLACQTIMGTPEAPTSPLEPPRPANTEPASPPENNGDPQPPTNETPAENPTEPPQPSINSAADPMRERDIDGFFEPLIETWEIIDRSFVDQPVNETLLIDGALTGMTQYLTQTLPLADVQAAIAAFDEEVDGTRDFERKVGDFWADWLNEQGASVDVYFAYSAISSSLDALGDVHTSYMDPDQFVQANIPLQGDYEGIGAWVDPDGEYLTIVSPMPGSPAEDAGLQPGDEVIKVDGEDMTGTDGNLVIRRVLGPAGSDVILTIRREGTPELFDVTITRGRITIPSVDGRILENTNIAYVQLFTFGQDTTDDLRDITSELLENNPDGMILDLRNNGGGFLNTAIGISSEFIADGVVMYERYGDGEEDVFEARSGGLTTDIPLVVLINGGSASASEIVAGAIQDYARGPLVGTTSFGKGSVQNWVPLDDEHGAVRVTIARWYTPDNRLIHEVGLEPDFVVEITEDDIENERDPQLDKAIELLTGE